MENNRLLVVGNGQYNEETQTLERSDAFTIMFNGDATLAGELTASAFIGDGSQLTNISSGPFSFNEDMRLLFNLLGAQLAETIPMLLEIVILPADMLHWLWEVLAKQ